MKNRKRSSIKTSRNDIFIKHLMQSSDQKITKDAPTKKMQLKKCTNQK
jgi:hypothetical protein